MMMMMMTTVTMMMMMMMMMMLRATNEIFQLELSIIRPMLNTIIEIIIEIESQIS